MADPLSGFQRVPGRRQRPVARGVAGMVAAVAILGGGLLAGRLLLDDDDSAPPAPAASPSPSRSTA